MFDTRYRSSIRNYIYMMGDLFSRINTYRYNEDGTMRSRTVPLTYASKEHFVSKLNSSLSVNNNDGTAKVEQILPRMYLNLIDIEYFAEGKTAIGNRAMVNINSNKAVAQFNPVPYKFRFELGITTRYLDDMFQIIEQILPFFQPHFTTSIYEARDDGNEFEFHRDVRIVLVAITPDEEIDGDVNSRRRIEYSIIFELVGWIYPPIANVSGLIKTIYLDFHANKSEVSDKVFESIDTQVYPLDTTYNDWKDDKQTITGSSENIPIPTGDAPSEIRKNK